MKIKTYQEALQYLSLQLPMFQKKGASALKAGLRNIDDLDEFLGHPHRQYPCIHIAGTNGKGSVAHMLAAVLQAAGLKVGLYTSPHYRDFRERIKVNGELATKEFLIDFLNMMQEQVRHIQPSFFELSVAMAFQYFAEQQVDVAVIETGLGGRTDSTNIITPILSIITNISYDHQSVLGDTLEEIAGHKAGIIKEGVPVVIGETQVETEPVFLQEAKEKKAPISFADQIWQVKAKGRYAGKTSFEVFSLQKLWADDLLTELSGDYQSRNLQTVLESVAILNKYEGLSRKIMFPPIQKGLLHLRELTRFIGRWQVVQEQPLVILDSAHNIGGMTYAVEQLDKIPHRQLHFVLGMVKDKDIHKVLKILPAAARYYFAKADIPRGLEAQDLADQAAEYGLKGEVFSSVTTAYESALQEAGEEDLVFVGGSIYVVAEVV
jgi:dihydrofolate synthase/folylpolyglutamate synthase